MNDGRKIRPKSQVMNTTSGSSASPSPQNRRNVCDSLPTHRYENEREIREREIAELRLQITQMEKTMRWWSDCTTNWREKWSQVKLERNQARDELRTVKTQMEELQMQFGRRSAQSENSTQHSSAQIRKNMNGKKKKTQTEEVTILDEETIASFEERISRLSFRLDESHSIISAEREEKSILYLKIERLERDLSDLQELYDSLKKELGELNDKECSEYSFDQVEPGSEIDEGIEERNLDAFENIQLKQVNTSFNLAETEEALIRYLKNDTDGDESTPEENNGTLENRNHVNGKFEDNSNPMVSEEITTLNGNSKISDNTNYNPESSVCKTEETALDLSISENQKDFKLICIGNATDSHFSNNKTDLTPVCSDDSVPFDNISNNSTAIQKEGCMEPDSKIQVISTQDSLDTDQNSDSEKQSVEHIQTISDGSQTSDPIQTNSEKVSIGKSMNGHNIQIEIADSTLPGSKTSEEQIVLEVLFKPKEESANIAINDTNLETVWTDGCENGQISNSNSTNNLEIVKTDKSADSQTNGKFDQESDKKDKITTSPKVNTKTDLKVMEQKSKEGCISSKKKTDNKAINPTEKSLKTPLGKTPKKIEKQSPSTQIDSSESDLVLISKREIKTEEILRELDQLITSVQNPSVTITKKTQVPIHQRSAPTPDPLSTKTPCQTQNLKKSRQIPVKSEHRQESRIPLKKNRKLNRSQSVDSEGRDSTVL